MDKPRILGCSDSIQMNTSYARQAKLVMEMTKGYDWHYIGLGYTGVQMAMDNGSYRCVLHPFTGNNLHVTNNMQKKVNELKPDIIWLQEDGQYIGAYANVMARAPIVGVFPWDTDTWLEDAAFALRNLDVPVTVSKFSKDLINAHGYEVNMIYNCVDDNVYKPVDEEKKKAMRERLGIEDGKKVLLYVGMMHYRKNIEALFAMASELKKIRGPDFVLHVHANPDDVFKSCEPFIEMVTRDISDVVQFTSNVDWSTGIPPEALNVMYNVADVFVSAHGGEGFGLPACEAGLCEKPFVMTDFTTTAEFSQEGKHGLATPIMTSRVYNMVRRPVPDHKIMAAQVSELLDNPKKRNSMGRSFRKWLLANCSRAVLEKKWSVLLGECLVNRVKVNEE